MTASCRRGWPILIGALLSCAPRAATPPRLVERSGLVAVESEFAVVRGLRDTLDVTRARGADSSEDGAPLADVVDRYRAARSRLVDSLGGAREDLLGTEDRRALAEMRSALGRDLTEEESSPARPDTAAPDCQYDAARLATDSAGRQPLAERVYACYGVAVQHVLFDGQTLDRLTVLGMLARTDDSAARRRLFLALDPVWRSINGDNGPTSPYRHLVRLQAPEWRAGRSPVDRNVRALGIDPLVMEQWLTAILARWRDVGPAELVEPWDYYYAAGEASRALSSRIATPADLVALNERIFADLGASPAKLGVRYDLEARPGKTPVAFTTFGSRPRLENGAWRAAVPWVFATYRVGGLDNLGELLHETGHAVHIAAIRTRPAFADWPDSDPLSEALGEIVALEAWEPEWQMRYLGDSVALAASLRARYSSIVLDIAWALFELRMHADPSRDPNGTWTDITREYLRIAPHPELSWWAMRGQLVESPGYMMNYAVGAIIVADLRARTREARGAFTAGDPGWYEWMSERLFRFGLERSSRDVVTSFLGRPVSPRALMSDLARMARPGSP